MIIPSSDLLDYQDTFPLENSEPEQYFDATTPWLRQHDVRGHREYIDCVSLTGQLPDIRQGWETWQPPLYYYLAAGWRALVPIPRGDDPFRPVQFLGLVLYLGTCLIATPIFHRLRLNAIEACAAFGLLALLPGTLFFAARINNDALLPVLGAGVTWATIAVAQSEAGQLKVGLGVLLAALLATKGTSIAVVGCASALLGFTEWRRTRWRSAVLRTYLTLLPSGLWLAFWWTRTVMQTGDPLYVNDDLPEGLRVITGPLSRILTLNSVGFLGGQYFYDPEMRVSLIAALLTSALSGEYGMNEYGFQCLPVLRAGLLGVLLICGVGACRPPRALLKEVWVTCLCLTAGQALLALTYAIKFPFACNQNMRFFAQAFFPMACLAGIGLNTFLSGSGWLGKAVAFIVIALFLVGLTDFYWHLLF